MSLTLYQATVPSFIRHLTALAAIIAKAEAYAAEKKFSPEALLQARLFPDMYNLIGQVQTACDQAKGAVARVAGVEVPKYADDEKSFADLKARIAKTLAFIQSIKPEQFAGRDDAEVTFPVGPSTRSMKAADYAINVALVHFYFHCTTAYAILRHNGLNIGKRDFFAPQG
ncbi:MAG TPA: DUF1993 domain-containing protein [Stellaceae bacterium]|nr:DUF1993 domain-containing protein [Stellaceae bacterium]